MDFAKDSRVKMMNDLDRIHVGRLRAYIDTNGIKNQLDMVIEAIEQDDEYDLQADDEYEESALHCNREWIMSVLTAASTAIDIDYSRWCDERRKENIEVLIKELEAMKK